MLSNECSFAGFETLMQQVTLSTSQVVKKSDFRIKNIYIYVASGKIQVFQYIRNTHYSYLHG